MKKYRHGDDMIDDTDFVFWFRHQVESGETR